MVKLSTTVQANNLRASFGSKTIWHDANLEIAPGEFIGLLGSNGSGKTTLLKMILGLIKPTAGRLVLFGKQIRPGNNLVGYMPQRRSLDHENRIASIEYVRLGLNGDRWGFSLPWQAKAERLQALQALRDVDAEILAERSLNELSGGEAQRVFLAQALVAKPQLLLLDEPMANLDIRRESQLIQIIHSLTKRLNIATVLIAHDINPLLPYVDRIIYIAGGKIATGRPEDIIKSETLSALYDSPVEVLRDSRGRLAVLGTEGQEHHIDEPD